MKPQAIRSLAFRHGSKPLGIELFRLSELYARSDRKAIDHGLETPQRPEFHTIYVGRRGRGRIVIDFQAVPLAVGALTFVAAGRVQQFVVDRAVDAWMLLVSPEVIEASPVLSVRWTEPHVAMAGERAAILGLVEAIASEQARPLDAQQPAILAALVAAVLHHAERLAAGRIAIPGGALERFFTILERDHARTRSVAHYAREAGVSPRRLGELASAHAGKSPKQLVDERVVLELQRRLVHTELSVKQLADALGFDEPTNLVKFFRHHTGTTPLAWRQNRRNLPSGRGS